MTTDHKTTEAELIEKLLEQLEEGVSWYDGNGHLQTFEDFGGEVRDRVTFFVRSRNGKSLDRPALYAYLKYMQIADLSAAHIPIGAVRRCDAIFDEFDSRIAKLATRQDGSEEDEILTRASAAWAEAKCAMVAERVLADCAANKASKEIGVTLMRTFGIDEGWELYLKFIKRLLAEHTEATAPSLQRKIEFRNRQDVMAYIEEIGRKTGKQITKAEIWRAAGYKARRECERWERGELKANSAVDRNIRRVLQKKPHLNP